MESLFLGATSFGAGCVVTYLIIRKARSQPTNRPDFITWSSNKRMLEHRESGSLEDELNEYIKLFDLRIQHELGEPRSIWLWRTKAEVLKEAKASCPELYAKVFENTEVVEKFEPYCLTANSLPQIWDQMSPQAKEIYRRKESQRNTVKRQRERTDALGQ